MPRSFEANSTRFLSALSYMRLGHLKIGLVIGIVIALVLVLSSQCAEADYQAFTPPYQGEVESGSQTYPLGTLAWGYAYKGDGKIDAGVNLDNLGASGEVYGEAGFYVTVNIPSDAVKLEVKATVKIDSLHDDPRAVMWYHTGWMVGSDDWLKVWLKAGIDKWPSRSNGPSALLVSITLSLIHI